MSRLSLNDKPRWENPCPHCVFLLCHNDDDWYWCSHHDDYDRVGEAIVGTYSNDSSEYMVWLSSDWGCAAGSEFSLALAEATRRGLVCKCVADENVRGYHNS